MMTHPNNHSDADLDHGDLEMMRRQEEKVIDRMNSEARARRAQNMLRIMCSLDEVVDVIGEKAALRWHRDPFQAAIHMDEPTWASVYALIERRQPGSGS